MNRFDTDVDDSVIGGIDGHGADVAFEYPAPTLTGIARAIEPVLGDTEIDDVGLAS